MSKMKVHLIDWDTDISTYCGRLWRKGSGVLRYQSLKVTMRRGESTCVNCQRVFDKIKWLNRHSEKTVFLGSLSRSEYLPGDEGETD